MSSARHALIGCIVAFLLLGSPSLHIDPGREPDGHLNAPDHIGHDTLWSLESGLCQSGFTASLIQGRIFVVGGGTGGVAGGSVDVYDISSETWQSGPSIPANRSHAGAAVAQDRLFVTGGYDERGIAQPSIFVLDPEEMKWSLFMNLSEGRAEHACIYSHGLLYLVGGVGPEAEPVNTTTVVEIATKREFQGRGLPIAVRGSRGGRHNGTVMVTGGMDTAGVTVGSTYVLEGDRWMESGDMPSARCYHGIANHPFGVVVAGGLHSVGGPVSIDANWGDAWSTIGRFKRAEGPICLCSHGDRLYAVFFAEGVGVSAERFDISPPPFWPYFKEERSNNMYVNDDFPSPLVEVLNFSFGYKFNRSAHIVTGDEIVAYDRINPRVRLYDYHDGSRVGGGDPAADPDTMHGVLFHEDTIYMSISGTKDWIIAWEGKGRSQLWLSELPVRPGSALMVHNDTLVVGTSDGLLWLNTTTGAVVDNSTNHWYTGQVQGEFAWTGEHLFYSDDRGYICKVDLVTRGLVGTAVGRAPLVLANDLLYASGEDFVRTYDPVTLDALDDQELTSHGPTSAVSADYYVTVSDPGDGCDGIVVLDARNLTLLNDLASGDFDYRCPLIVGDVLYVFSVPFPRTIHSSLCAYTLPGLELLSTFAVGADGWLTYTKGALICSHTTGVVKYVQDLDLSTSGLSWSCGAEAPSTTDTVSFTVNVTNKGSFDAFNATVMLFDGSPDSDSENIGSVTIERLASNSTMTLWFNWTAIAGQHDIHVYVDFLDAITEVDEGNNEDLLSLTVNSPPWWDPIGPLGTCEDESIDDLVNLSRFSHDVDGPSVLRFGILPTTDANVSARVSGDDILGITPGKDFFGTVWVDVAASDSVVATPTSIRIDIAPVNDAPRYVQPPVQEAVEDLETVLDLADYIWDVDDPLEDLTLSVDSPHCRVVDGTHALVFLYPNNATSEFVNITVSDGRLSTVITLFVNVTPLNDPPTFRDPGPQVAVEDVPLLLDLTGWVWDIDTPPEDLVLTTNSSYCTVGAANHTLVFLYPNNATSESVNVTLSDGEYEVHVEVHVTVVPVNDPPEVHFTGIWTIIEDARSVLDLGPYVADVDSPREVLTLDCPSPFVTVDGLRLVGYLDHWEPDCLVGVTVSDGESNSETSINVNITNVNDLPVITSRPSNRGRVGEVYIYQIEFSDEDPFDVHSFGLSGPEGMTVDANGLLSWTPGRDQYHFHGVEVLLDDGSVRVHQLWTILVLRGTVEGNRPPYYTDSPLRNATAGEVYRWTASAEDPDGDVLYYHLLEGPTGSTVDHSTGEIAWYTGPGGREISFDASFQVEVCDGQFNVSLDFVVRVRNPPNRSPSILGRIPDIDTMGLCTVDLTPYMHDPDDPFSNLTWRVEMVDEGRLQARIEGEELVIEPAGGVIERVRIQLFLEDPSGASDSQTIVVDVDVYSTKDAPWGLYVIGAIMIGCLIGSYVHCRRSGRFSVQKREPGISHSDDMAGEGRTRPPT